MERGVDYEVVGVGAIIVDSEGRLFPARQGPRAISEGGLWGFPYDRGFISIPPGEVVAEVGLLLTSLTAVLVSLFKRKRTTPAT